MFGLKKNDFGNALAQAKKKSQAQEDGSLDRYLSLIDKGIFEMSLLTNGFNQNKSSFSKAASYFEQAIALKSLRPEAYYYLSWLFSFIDELEKARIYYNICFSIDKDFKGLSQLSKVI